MATKKKQQTNEPKASEKIFDKVIVERYENGMIYFRATKIGESKHSYHATGQDAKVHLIKISTTFEDCLEVA